ncbi:MAG: hypothetical protein PVI09_04310 [Anaerolineae bacterium]|jgi:hypothetical protein
MYQLDLRTVEAMMSLRREQARAQAEQWRLLAAYGAAPVGWLSMSYRRALGRLGQCLVVMGEYLQRTGFSLSLADRETG